MKETTTEEIENEFEEWFEDEKYLLQGVDMRRDTSDRDEIAGHIYFALAVLFCICGLYYSLSH